MSCTGGQQGCTLSTTLTCSGYRVCLQNTQRAHPSVRIISFADDTTLNGPPHVLYPAFAHKRKDCWDTLHLRSKMPAVLAYSPRGDLTLIPEFITAPDGSLDALLSRNADGSALLGFRCVGTFFGNSAWRSAAIAARIMDKLANLDNIDSLTDTETITDTTASRLRIIRNSAYTTPPYWFRLTSPVHTVSSSHTAHSSKPTPPPTAPSP